MSFTLEHAHRNLADVTNPSTPAFEDPEWISAYLGIHMLSHPSQRYAYLLWAVFALIFLLYALVHLVGAHGGYAAARWSQLATRRGTWKVGPKDQRRTLFMFPSHGRLISTLSLILLVAVACVVGPDYIKPTEGVFEFSSSRRQLAGTWNPLQFLNYAPQYTIQKAWWTAGGRTGMIAFALLPLCVSLALKAPPFAIFSIPHLIHLSFDKLGHLHRLTAWIIWILSAVHTALWSVQLFLDKRTNTQDTAYSYAWSASRFIFGWTAFGLFTVLMLTTLSPLRQHHYETFYFLHVLLVPMGIVTAALHHPPIWQWCWAALGLWLAERLYRGMRWAWLNHALAAAPSPFTPTDTHKSRWSERTLISPPGSDHSHGPIPLHGGVVPFILKESVSFPLPSAPPLVPTGSTPQSQHSDTATAYPPTPFSPASASSDPQRWSDASSTDHLHSPTLTSAITPAPAHTYVPPPGFAHAELMAGHTVRLIMTPARHTAWEPGQHFLLMIPHITRFLTHPFTVATSDHDQVLVFIIRAKAGWTRDLWNTVAALSHRGVCVAPGESLPAGWEPPKKGVVMRALIDGPFGSSGRVRWGAYGTAVIYAGGSGVSFGLSILQHLCLRMAGRDQASMAGRAAPWQLGRVRFVWLVREYAHLQWCAAIIRRCLEMVPAPGLQIDIFVTSATPDIPRLLHPAEDHTHHQPHQSAPTSMPLIEVILPTLESNQSTSALPSFAHDHSPFNTSSPAVMTPSATEGDRLAPPIPGFARARSPRGSLESTKTASSGYSAFDISYYRAAGRHSGLSNLASSALDVEGQRTAEDEDIGHDADLTNWDGEDDNALPGERRISRQVAKAGTKRRMSSIRQSMGGRVHDFGVSSEHRGSTISREMSRPISTALITSRVPSGIPDGSTQLSGQAPGHRPRGSHDRLVHGPSPLVTGVSSNKHARPSSTSLLPSPIPEGEDSEEDSATIVSRPDTPDSTWDHRVSMHSASSLFADVSAGRTIGHRRTPSERVRLEIERRELRELAHVAEFAHPGRPNIRTLLQGEVDRASGPIVVAVCGPSALNTVTRNAVASLIDPSRVWRGDQRGRIDLVSEEYEY